MKKRNIIIACCLSIVVAFELKAENNVVISCVVEDTIKVFHDTNDVSLIVYKPLSSHWGLSITRPDSNDKTIIFCCPAAFTAQNYKDIVGNIVAQGQALNNPTEKENGYCVILNDRMFIKSLEDSCEFYQQKTIKEKGSYFQQMLLILNSKQIPCTIFGKQKPTFRRALAQKDNSWVIVESLNRMDVNDFSSVMIEQGFTDAIYLDMGTWSEGYYINNANEKVSIGRLKHNTKSQTNWLVVYKELLPTQPQ